MLQLRGERRRVRAQSIKRASGCSSATVRETIISCWRWPTVSACHSRLVRFATTTSGGSQADTRPKPGFPTARCAQMAAAALAGPGPRHRPSQRSGGTLHPPRVRRPHEARPAWQPASWTGAFRPGHHNAAIWLAGVAKHRRPAVGDGQSTSSGKSDGRREAFPRRASTAPSFDDHRRAEQALAVDEGELVDAARSLIARCEKDGGTLIRR